MPKIVDPSCLTVGPALTCCVEMKVCTCCSVITLGKGTTLTDCGVTLQAVYSRVKQLWKDTDDPCTPCVAYAAFQFPFISITDEQYELINGWSLGTKGCNGCVTKLLIRDGGWARVDANDVRQEEYMGLATLGAIDTANGGLFQATCPCDLDFACATITRGSGSWLVDGFTTYNPITITNAQCGANDITFTATCITATVITAGCVFCPDTCDCAATITQLGTGFAYYTQCTDILCCLNATTDINLAGPVNQAVRISRVIANELVTCAGDGPLIFVHSACAADTIAKQACTTWSCCFDFPGFVTITGACEAANNGTFLVESVCMEVLTLNDGSVACSGETVVGDASDPSSVRFVQEIDNRNFFQVYLREEQKNYDFYDLIVCQNLTRGLVNKKFALPLSDSIDNKVTCNDAVVDGLPCICMVTISYFQTNQPQDISCTCFCYRIVIDAACNVSNANVYQFVQKELRALVDICDRGGCTADAAEVVDIVLPAEDGLILPGDYWIINSAQDQRLYHVWYQVCSSGTEPVIDLSTGILVDICACDAASAVATKTHAALVTSVSGLTKNTHLLDFTASVCCATVTITNSFDGRTTDARNSTGTSAIGAGFSATVTTQGDLATTIGETQTELLTFVGCCLVTSTGVFIDNVLCACTNCTTHTDVCGIGRQFAFVATGVLTFNTNLVCDAGPAQYFMYYTTTAVRTVQAATVNWDDMDACLPCCIGSLTHTCACVSWAATPYFLVAGDVMTVSNACCAGNDQNFRIVSITGCMSQILGVACTVVGCDDACDVICVATPNLAFGSNTASFVKNNCDMDITGCICMSCISFNWDYDGNFQGGRVIACPPACSAVGAVTVVAIGLCSAQYVTATSTIARTKTNNISIVGALERNFDDPC